MTEIEPLTRHGLACAFARMQPGAALAIELRGEVEAAAKVAWAMIASWPPPYRFRVTRMPASMTVQRVE